MIDLSKHVALVTGGSRGIGRSCALRLAQAGADVIVNYVSNRTAAESVAAEIVEMGRQTMVIKADMSEEDDVAALAEAVADTFDHLDILVNNAAGGGFRPLLTNTTRHFQTTFAVNTEAFLHLLQSLFPLLEESGRQPGPHGPRRAKVVSLSSHGSRVALPGYSLVGASKAALEGLTRSAALELGPKGINLNVVVAGLVDTDAVKNLPGRDEILKRNDAMGLTGGRRLLADDVADVVLFLSSPLADQIQGQAVIVDCGAAIVGAR